MVRRLPVLCLVLAGCGALTYDVFGLGEPGDSAAGEQDGGVAGDGGGADAGARDAGGGDPADGGDPVDPSLRDIALWPVGQVGVFEDRGDGTVAQEATGLVWQKDAPSGIYYRSEAEAACERLSLPGGGWRLPRRIELLAIADWSRTPAFAAAFTGPSDSVYWSATAATGIWSGAWWTVGVDGRSTPNTSSGAAVHLRCVRGGRAPPTGARYTAGTAGARPTVTDNVTGLVWQKLVHTGVAHFSAEGTCAALGSGWRLPGALELSTLVDPARSAPAVDAAFDVTSAQEIWSSTVSPTGTRAFLVRFDDGELAIEDRAELNAVRCVRSP